MRDEKCAGSAVFATDLDGPAVDTLTSGDLRGERSHAHDSGTGEAIRGYDPLRFCPTEQRARHAARARAATTSPKNALMLRCLDCCAWDRREVKRCEIRTCALFALSVRYFGRVELGAPSAAAEAGDELLEVDDA